jgi:hypothetical protein
MTDRLVTVATFGDRVEAAMERYALEAGGIRTYLLAEEAVAVNGSLGNALGSIKLQVHAWDFERSELLLSRQAREAAEHPPDEDALETALTTAEAAEEFRHEQAEQAPDCRWEVWAAVVINIPMLLVDSVCMWPICGIRL